MALKYTTNDNKEVGDFYTLDYDIEDGKVFWKNKEVGYWIKAHDSQLGSYIFKHIGKEDFHDHYHSEEYIIKKAELK